MKRIIHGNRPMHAYTPGETGIRPENPCFGCAFYRGIEMNDLRMAVHPGISATGTMNPHRRVGDIAQGLFEFLLYGLYIEMRLALPAVVLTAVVFNAAGYAGTRR